MSALTTAPPAAPTKGSMDLTIQWNTYGIPVLRSSLFQLWPLQCIITDLPPFLRRKYLLVTGLWVGKCKSNMTIFMKPFCDKLQELNETAGFKWTHPDDGTVLFSKVIAPLAKVDAPARAALQNIGLWNVAYGCYNCEHPGSTHTFETGGH